MGRMKLKSAFVAGLASLLLCMGNIKDSTLLDVTKPYLGEYECEYARLGDKEFSDGFEFVTLELKRDGTYLLSFKQKDGEKHTETGAYQYDAKRNLLCISPRDKSALKKEFPLIDGVLTISAQIGNQQLIVRFAQK